MEEEVKQAGEPALLANHAVVSEEKSDKNAFNQLIEYYSSWIRLKKAVAWWLRLKGILLKKIQGDDQHPDTRRGLTTDELEQAERAIVRCPI